MQVAKWTSAAFAALVGCDVGVACGVAVAVAALAVLAVAGAVAVAWDPVFDELPHAESTMQVAVTTG